MPAPAHLIDSNILLRIARRDAPDHAMVDAALVRLVGDEAVLYIGDHLPPAESSKWIRLPISARAYFVCEY